MKRAVLFALAGAVFLGFLQSGPTVSALGSTPDALSFFKNYFITGDYAVGGIGLRGQGVGGIATGAIQMTGVPSGADIAAAYLYWQVVAKDSAGLDAGSLTATFRGKPLSSTNGEGGAEPFAKQLGLGTAPCWSGGGGTGSSGGTNKTYTYRADVLRFFDVDNATGKFAINGAHPVQIPDGNGTIALGASLVIVYRNPDPITPLSAIVMYDGGYTMDQSTQAMSQRVQGFYEPATTTAKITFLMGSGQANKSERVTFNGEPIANPFNPFQALQGASWDNPTFAVTSPTGLSTVTAGVDHEGFSSFDCLTWAGVVYKTEVKDSDGDGLLDSWETAGKTTGSVYDPKGVALPQLGAMGADPNKKDIFMEIGYMDAPEQAYGGAIKPAHSHLPTHETLKLVGDAFKNAPGGIAIHFDAGSAYPDGDLNDPAKNAEEYLVRVGARGGDQIPEQATVCQRGLTDAPWICQFSEYPGTVGWKTGFRLLRDEPLSVTLSDGTTPTPTEDNCEQPGATCTRRFDQNRKNIFRYALFAHALGVPKAEEPCLTAAPANQPVQGDPATGLCAAPLRDNPKFHTPVTNTGVGDFPGGDVMLTLGAFNDVNRLPIGTPFMQASTLMHEFGHNAQRRHGGDPSLQNCTPTYLSVMNYLYQLRGLLDDNGKPHLDFSRGVISPSINETFLADGSHSSLPYRIGYYAPLAGSYLDGLQLNGASKHCDGTNVMAGEPPMIRIDARRRAAPIDWNANGASESPLSFDVNFNGDTQKADGSAEILNSSDDWSQLALNQIGFRRNTGGLFVIDSTGRLAVGPLSLDSGRGDLGRGDLGRGDLGRGDLGRGDLGRGDLGRGDLGRGDLGRGDLGRGDLGTMALGRGDLGRGDLGGGDLFLNDPDNPTGELDYDLTVGTAKAPTNEFRACILGVGTCALPVGASLTPTWLHRVRLDWKSPNVGDVQTYTVYRAEGAELTTGGQARPILGTVASVIGQGDYSFVDMDQLTHGAEYTYFIIATYGDGTKSDLSNLVTITAINESPIAGTNSYTTTEDTPLAVVAPGVLGNDSDTDSPIITAKLVIASANGGTALVNSDGSFTYTPPAGFAGTDTFTYGATDTKSTTNATVTVVVKRIVYEFVGVQNLPATKPANLGSSVPLRWRFKLNGVVFDSSAARPQIVIVNSAGVLVYTGDPTDPGASSFAPPSLANNWTWGFNWQTKGLLAGTYRVYVGTLKTGQVYSAGSAFGPFAVTLR